MATNQKESFGDSIADALKAGNIFKRIVMFLFFALITGAPYLIHNINRVPLLVAQSGATGWLIGLEYMKALSGAMWKGVFIGLSTVLVTIGDAFTGTILIGNIGYSVIVVAFASAMVYQPLRLFLNVIDMKEGRENSSLTVAVISVCIVLFVLSGIAYLVTGGETITSRIDDDSVVSLNESINASDEVVVNDSVLGSSVPVIDMGGSS